MTIAEAKEFLGSLKGSYQELDKLATSVNSNMLQAYARAQKDLYRRVERFIADTPSLSKMDSQARLAWYGAEGRRFATMVQESKFYDISKQYLAQFDKMAHMAETALKSGGVAASWANVPQDFIKALQSRDYSRFAFLGDEAVRKLDDTFLDMVIGGMNRADMLAAFRGMITGEYAWGDKTGLYEWHAGTYVRTATHRHMQSFMNQQAQDAGLENFMYLGPYDAKTRPFCSKIVGGVFKKSEIEEMDNGQDGLVFESGGGFNCRHEWMAISDDLAKTILDNPDELGKDEVNKIEPKESKAAEAKTSKRITKTPEPTYTKMTAGDFIKWSKGLTKEERLAVSQWTRSDYRVMRILDAGKKALIDRLKSEWSPEYVDRMKQHLKELYSALNKAPKKYYGTVYRGLGNMGEANFRALIASAKNGTLTFDAAASATESLTVAEGFANCRSFEGSYRALLRLKLKGGGVDISNLSSYVQEKEVIITKGSKFRIVSTSVNRDRLLRTKKIEMTLEQI